MSSGVGAGDAGDRGAARNGDDGATAALGRVSRRRQRRLSGLQLEVLSLLRHCLRAAQAQPTEASREAARAHVLQAFRDNATRVKRSDFTKIEYLVRTGKQKLKNATRPGAAGFAVTTVVSRPAKPSHDDGRDR